MMNLKCELHFTEMWDLLNAEFRTEPYDVKLDSVIIFTLAATNSFIAEVTIFALFSRYQTDRSSSPDFLHN